VTTGGQSVEPLGASTMPQSVLPSPSQFNPSTQAQGALDDGVDLDLDLDLDGGGSATSPAPLQATQPMAPQAAASGRGSMSLDLPDFPPPSAAAARAPAPSVEFDLAGISLDLDLPTTGAKSAPAAISGFGESDLPALDDVGDGADPLARKLELAEEFRQIGDTEGARDLLQEVVAKASGTLKSKAQGMLDQLA
jgi:pilus assembly protein FimV